MRNAEIIQNNTKDVQKDSNLGNLSRELQLDFNNNRLNQYNDKFSRDLVDNSILPALAVDGMERSAQGCRVDESKCSEKVVNWKPDVERKSESARQWDKDAHKQDQLPIELNKEGKYEVKPGDSLSGIAERELKQQGKGTSQKEINKMVDEIVQANKEKFPDLDCNKNLIRTGMELTIPNHKTAACDVPSEQKEMRTAKDAPADTCAVPTEQKETRSGKYVPPDERVGLSTAMEKLGLSATDTTKDDSRPSSQTAAGEKLESAKETTTKSSSWHEARQEARKSQKEELALTGERIIKSGDTLWDIAKSHLEMYNENGQKPSNQEILAEVKRLAQVNKIQDYNNIKLGTVIKMESEPQCDPLDPMFDPLLKHLYDPMDPLDPEFDPMFEYQPEQSNDPMFEPQPEQSNDPMFEPKYERKYDEPRMYYA